MHIMKVFMPITDEMLEQGMLPDELAPYSPGQVTLSQLRHLPALSQSRSIDMRSPGPTPNSKAVPPLSSSTYIAGRTLR